MEETGFNKQTMKQAWYLWRRYVTLVISKNPYFFLHRLGIGAMFFLAVCLVKPLIKIFKQSNVLLDRGGQD